MTIHRSISLSPQNSSTTPSAPTSGHRKGNASCAASRGRQKWRSTSS